MKKLSSFLMLAMMCLAAVGFAACGGGDDDNGGNNGGNGGGNSGGNGGGYGGGSSTNTITLIKSNGEKYVSIAQFSFTQQNGTTKNGYLTTNGEIWCMMSKESAFNPTYLHVKLLKGEKAISDFPQGYNLGNVNVTFSQISYTYQSGTVKVKSNGGNTFILEFKDYIAKSSRYSSDVTINGTLLCEKEVLL